MDANDVFVAQLTAIVMVVHNIKWKKTTLVDNPTKKGSVIYGHKHKQSSL